MSIEETQQIVEAFVDTGAECWLAESVQLSAPTRLVASGRTAVRDALAELHASDADDDRSIQTRVVVGDGIAAVETRPRSDDRHERDSEPPYAHRGGRSTACFYEVSGGEIVRASVYVETATIDPTAGDTTTATGTSDVHSERRTDQ